MDAVQPVWKQLAVFETDRLTDALSRFNPTVMRTPDPFDDTYQHFPAFCALLTGGILKGLTLRKFLFDVCFKQNVFHL